MGIKDTIAPKSDQLNADDLIAGPRTITIREVKVTGKSNDVSPVSIYFDGDNGKPYKPSKGMRRVLINLWGDDEQKYVGRSMTIYRDEKVIYAGEPVGGIRISHMSHIDDDVSMPLTISKAIRKPYMVRKMSGAGNVVPPETIAEFERLIKLVPDDIAAKARQHIAKHGNQAGYEKMIARLTEVSGSSNAPATDAGETAQP